jgi:hypothetical protein
VLARFVDDDPLELGPRCAEALRVGSWLLDHERLFLRAAARAAHRGWQSSGRPALDAWLKSVIDDSIAELLTDDREAERSGLPLPVVSEPRYAALSGALGIEPLEARAACVRFNRLPRIVRRAFFAIFIERVPLDRYTEEAGQTMEQVEMVLGQALRALSGVRTDDSNRRGPS